MAERGDPNPGFDARLGANIQRYRTALGMSQAELAERLSDYGEQMHQQTVQKIEKGSRPLRLSEAVHIAEILGVSVVDFAKQAPDTDASVRLQRRNVAVASAAQDLSQSIVVLADELGKLAVVYARYAIAEEKPAADIAERALGYLEFDWEEELVSKLIDRLGGRHGQSTRQILASVVKRAQGFDGDMGLLVENAVLGIDQ